MSKMNKYKCNDSVMLAFFAALLLGGSILPVQIVLAAEDSPPLPVPMSLEIPAGQEEDVHIEEDKVSVPEDIQVQADQVLTPVPAAASQPSVSTPPALTPSAPVVAEKAEGLPPTVTEKTGEPAMDLQAPNPGLDMPVASAPITPEVKAVPYSGTYYDADSIGPGELGAAAGPRNVDPKYEPGSRFVTVKKTAGDESREARIVAAQRALSLGRYSSALAIYEDLYKSYPKHKQILMGLAVAQQESGFKESAIATYEELLKLDPKNAGATVNLMGLLEERQPDMAYSRLMKMWERNSQNPAVAAQLGLVSAKMNDYEGASRYLGIAASLEPENAQHYYNLAIVYDHAQSTKQAIEYYQKALEIDVIHTGGRALPKDQIYDRLAVLRRQ